MKHRIIFFYLLFTFPLFAQTSEENEKSDDWKLWYRFPAREWEEALPVGNGHMGGMVYGGIDREHIALNEETIWSFPFQQVELNSRKQILIDEQRKLILEGKYEEAKKLKWNKLEIPDNFEVIKEKPEGFVTGRSIYKPLADLYLHFGSTSSLPYDYKRELDIENAVARVTYKVDNVTFKREVIASYPDKVIVVRLTASKPGQISVSSKMTRRVDVKDDMYRYDAELGAKVESIKTPPAPHIKVLDDDHFSFSGKADPDGVSYVAHFKLINEGGKRVPIENGFKVENADAVTIFITAATDFNYDDPDKIARKQMKKASSYSYDELFQRHVTDYKTLYDRVDIQMEKTRNSKMSTDRRVMAHQMGIKDPRVTPGTPRDNNLYALYFQYSRYLMIASSRKGTMPPALQGIWNNSLLPPWFGHYTTDINIEMNYWPAEVCNLSESHDVLLDFVFPHLDKCKRAAEIEYGTRGMVFNSMSPWGPRRGYQDWNGFAGWLAQHFWEHYSYTLDKEYLKTKAYPWIKEVALFHVDYAIEYPDSGYLVIGPEYSPENHFYYSDGEEKKKGHISMGTTMSRAIAWEVLDNAIKASEILDVDEDLRKEFIQTKDKLSPYKIGKHGQLQEWLMDYDEPHPGHRHLSHLYGLYPGNEITKKNSPEIFEAARKSIDRRLENNGGWTGWSRAWIICLAAHLQDGELAREQLELLFEQTTLYNLFDTHPRQGGNTTCFQIEGNMGATAGIAEMIMQSHEGCINLLPAKPNNWKKGHITGLRARGAFEVDVFWDKGILKSASIHSDRGGKCKLKYGEKIIEFDTKAGQTYHFDGNLK